jgi:adenylosuccinate synthase
MSVTAVIGSQWGDEGKGKVVDYLAEQADYVARYNGANNAGHTVINQYGTFKIHLVPSGIFAQNAVGLIGGGVVIDPAVLLEEIEMLNKAGVGVEGRLWISPRAHLIMPYHKILDGLYEEAKGAGATGTTRRGIGPVFADKVSYNGIRWSDFGSKAFESRLQVQLELKNKIIGALDGKAIRYEQVRDAYRDYYLKLKPYIRELFSLVQDGLKAGKHFLLEQAMGTFLDTDWGTYPFVTASTTIPSAASAGLGIPPRYITNVVAVTKAYTTRVGAGPLPTEIHDMESNAYRKFAETAATTGRTRRVGWLDLEIIRTAVQLSGATELCLTKLDVLSGLKEIKVCTRYELSCDPIRYADVDAYGLDDVETVYETLPGWEEDLSRIHSFEELPVNAQDYVKRIEVAAGVPVKWIGVGPEREATIRR